MFWLYNKKKIVQCFHLAGAHRRHGFIAIIRFFGMHPLNFGLWTLEQNHQPVGYFGLQNDYVNYLKTATI